MAKLEHRVECSNCKIFMGRSETPKIVTCNSCLEKEKSEKKKKIAERYGELIYEDRKVVIRKDKTFVCIHYKKDGKEQRPGGYVLGYNALDYNQ